MNTQSMQLDDCWNRIGIWSHAEQRCPELEKFVHCRNCHRYAEAGRRVLARPVPDDYRSEWTERYSRPPPAKVGNTRSSLLFRLGDEWLALDSVFVREITPFRTIQGLPHRSNSLVKGLVNIRGELKICISLGSLLGLEKARDEHTGACEIHERMICIEKDGRSFVFPASEVHGIHRYPEAALQAVPASVARSRNRLTAHLLPWKEHHVGLLDHELLFFALNGELK
jgi:chemotaxis-related protein WspD